MGRPQDWCYSCYEIPPRGVSSDNPAGHLLMAMRNRDERPSLSAAFMRLQAVAGFYYASDQSLLSGVLSILPWQLIFVPCVNSAEVEWPNTNLVRQTIMQTLRPIEPGFQRPWASGMPGTIALAKVDCVLAVDRHSRVYRFDPIIKRWSATTDGVKPTVSGLFNGSSSDVPHTPHRLLILTTDLEVYGFRLCMPNMIVSESGDYQLISTESQSKKLVKSFIKNLTTTVAHVRSSTGIELAVEYFNDADSHPPFTERTSQQHLDVTVSPKSIDPFNPPVDTILDQCYRPINRNPVHPIHRLHQNWDHFDPDDCVWVENTKFSFCRTYPLRVPSVPLKRVLLGARTYFEGNRFPMLSYLYKKNAGRTEQNSPTNVWVLRSGHVESSVDVRSIINCDSPHVLPIRLVHIQLDETSFKDLSGSLIDASQTNFQNFRSRSLSEVLTRNIPLNNGFESPSRWFVPTLKDSYWRFIPRSNEKQLKASLRPPDTDFQDCQECNYNMSWPTPSAKTVEQAWIKLGNLARLPQLHIPHGERETPNLHLSKSQGSINTLDDLTGYSKRHPSTVKCPAGPTFMTPEVTRRNLVGHRPSAPSIRISALSVTYVNNSEEKSPSHSVPNNLKHAVPLQRKLSSVAAGCSPHRSSWNDNFNATRWMALLSASLDQAVRLADCVRHLASCCHTASSGYYLLISGPGSGRTWQAIITSLLQIILSPETRTLAGFEDLIEHEWVRAGYPFAPDPSDWHDSSVSNDYDSCASFALFLDCVHQLLLQFPVDFGFTEDYLVFLLDTALSRGGGLPPFAIEFSCSCDAARCVSSKAKSPKQVAQQSDELCQKGVLRSFRDWTNVLTDRGLELLPNWRYWWYWHLNPTEIKDRDHALISTFSPPFRIMPELFPTVSPASYLRCWVHGWFRWNRSLRLAAGGGYAFDAAVSRSLLGPPEDEPLKELHRIKTSTSPYIGWMSDEAIEAAESLFDENFLDFLNSNSVAPLIRLVSDWELLPDLASQP
ncbi:hypothetical protein CSKR_105830 [Clonorchis sinensis]|uniref:Myotubularin phosphatase domain-containing protein n=2 Tax=Clonorchis sinensis TaxID=79923 RepID=A0A8T1MC90_CLOSI|nr:hypothetical protein CSKR_105830 [Clonorchis sinensis]